MLFENRQEAGKKLAKLLTEYENRQDVIVLALPRGGVVIGYEISHLLGVDLDLILVRKLGVPWQEELAFGAIAGDDIIVLNQSIVDACQISSKIMDEIIAKEKKEL